MQNIQLKGLQLICKLKMWFSILLHLACYQFKAWRIIAWRICRDHVIGWDHAKCHVEMMAWHCKCQTHQKPWTCNLNCRKEQEMIFTTMLISTGEIWWHLSRGSMKTLITTDYRTQPLDIINQPTPNSSIETPIHPMKLNWNNLVPYPLLCKC